MQKKIVVTSIDELMRFFELDYDPSLPDPNTYQRDTVRFRTPADLKMLATTDVEPTEQAYKSEVYKKSMIVYQGKMLKVWVKE